jgi:hypothetical protein
MEEVEEAVAEVLETITEEVTVGMAALEGAEVGVEVISLSFQWNKKPKLHAHG